MATGSDAAIAKALGDRKPKTRRGRKILADREPKIQEDAKTALIIRGTRACPAVMSLLRDLHRLRTPLSVMYSRPHEIHPLEDPSYLEKLCRNFDHGLFAFGSSSKKRPFRLIFGRLFDGGLLDMMEFKVSDYKAIASFDCLKHESVLGSKPMLIFQGSGFETDDKLKRVKSLLLDFLGGAAPDKVLLEGLEHVIVVTAPEHAVSAAAAGVRVEDASMPGIAASEPAVLVRRFSVQYQKSGSKLPRVELAEVGPRFTLAYDRTKEPDRDKWKQAIKVPKAAKPKKVKNISTTETGKKHAKIHLGKQDFDQIHTVHHSKAKDKKLRAELDIAARKKARKGGAPAPVEA